MSYWYKYPGHRVNAYSPPKPLTMAARVCVQKSFLENSTFNQWLDGETHTYVGDSLEKYSGGKFKDSIWAPSNIFKLYPDASIDTKLFHYEEWARSHMMEELHHLYGEILGCFCHPLQKCHSDILVRLVQETFTQPFDEVSSQTSPPPDTPSTGHFNMINPFSIVEEK